MGILKQTKVQAETFAKFLPARVYALTGDLGAGKTTFTQFFLRALGVQEPITSPTFVIIKKYNLLPTLNPKRFTLMYHIDCYRLKDPSELSALGFKEIIENKNTLVIIEWADRVRDLIPHDAQWIHFEHGAEEGERVISYVS